MFNSHIGSMEMVYLPTFPIKINIDVGKYTVRPMDPMGLAPSWAVFPW